MHAHHKSHAHDQSSRHPCTVVLLALKLCNPKELHLLTSLKGHISNAVIKKRFQVGLGFFLSFFVRETVTIRYFVKDKDEIHKTSVLILVLCWLNVHIFEPIIKMKHVIMILQLTQFCVDRQCIEATAVRLGTEGWQETCSSDSSCL
jgi:hypothetical protein